MLFYFCISLKFIIRKDSDSCLAVGSDLLKLFRDGSINILGRALKTTKEILARLNFYYFVIGPPRQSLKIFDVKYLFIYKFFNTFLPLTGPSKSWNFANSVNFIFLNKEVSSTREQKVATPTAFFVTILSKLIHV